MSPIETSLQHFFQQYPHQEIVVAYSGGVDSQVLLHALAHLRNQNKLPNLLSACHVNHGLSKNAANWQEAAENYCRHLNIPLTVCQLALTEKKQHSLEELARDARYKALKNTAPQQALIVTGHHGDDQAETFLLSLKRGAGIKGLSAMKSVVNFEHQLLVRPLLSVSRTEIEQYAQVHHMVWQEDESNADVRFDRNFIRHQIMPALADRWPSILTTINRSTQHCQESQTLLDELASIDLNLCLSGNERLSTDKLKRLSKHRFNNLLRYFLSAKNYLMPSTKQLEQVFKQLTAQTNKSPAMKLGNYWIRIYQQELYITEDFDDLVLWQQSLTENSPLLLPDNLGELILLTCNEQPLHEENIKSMQSIIAPIKQQKITIKFKHNNEKCLPDFRQHSRPVKKVLQELAIAPWQRKRIPFLYYDDMLVAAVGYFVCQKFVPNEQQARVKLAWYG